MYLQEQRGTCWREGNKDTEKWRKRTELRKHDDMQIPDLVLSRFSLMLLPVSLIMLSKTKRGKRQPSAVLSSSPGII